MEVCPCKDCPDRWAKCRIGCAKFRDWRKAYDKQMESNLKKKNQYKQLNEYEVDKTRRLKKMTNTH